MKKIISMILVLTFVLAACVTVMPVSAATIAPGVVNATGYWEVIDGGIRANTAQSVLVLEQTATKGTLEFEINTAAVRNNSMPGVFLQGTGFENINVLGNAAMEQMTTDSVMCWTSSAGMNISSMLKGQWTGGTHHGSGKAFNTTLGNGKNWSSYEEATIKFKIVFGDGKLTHYVNDVLQAEDLAYTAVGNQIALRGQNGDGKTPTEFTNIKLDGKAITFSESIAESAKIINATGNWEVIDGGIRANSDQSCLVIDKTLEAGTIEFDVNTAMIRTNGQPALFFAGTGFENVNVLGNAPIEQCTTDSVMCWITTSGMNISAMAAGQWTGGTHHGTGKGFLSTLGNGKNWNSYEKETVTFKIVFGEGKVSHYVNGVLQAENLDYSAVGNQIAFRGQVRDGISTEITNIKINGTPIRFTESVSTVAGATAVTGNWAALDNDGGVKSLSPASILLLDKTQAAGTVEFSVNTKAILENKQPAVFLNGTGFENVTKMDNAGIESATTDSVMCWIRSTGLTVTPMNKGQWPADGHVAKEFKDLLGEDWAEKNEKLTFKFVYGDGKVTSYVNGVLHSENVAVSATGVQIAFRGQNGGTPVEFTNIVVEEAKAPEVKPPVDSGDATLAVAGLVVLAGICAGAAITYAKKRTVA